ncbi:glutathione S-transferase family protein [Craterilacuibacter sinensis]|uniref:Glutathione S-transferase n=1 Tax=Craterilacuibacter sinensis TaxID=2686017 RepID=A0A845BMJ4_9NEIS|nr:glutathione S-transferase family protein [Craterilacuibacter sinensis]MXR36494.1 glutathione S-transferase [Craterilacuibacter sinensis]RQW28549.1 glutathione S-transferase family protein [Rhodobacteraceae bacterium CH30]
MLTVYGRHNSANVQKVLWMLAELGLDFERINAGGSFGGGDRPDYLRLNPNGKVPTLVDGDLALFESNTIVRYLAARYGGERWWPADPAVRAAQEKWMDWQLSTLADALGTVFVATIKTEPERRDQVMIAKAAARLHGCWQLLAPALAGRDYLAGAEPGVADIVLGTMFARYRALPITHLPLPALDAWFSRLSARPGCQTHVLRAIGTTPQEWLRLERA